jgi:hypothetical protein
MHRVDFVALELGKPGFVYPSLGVWRLGIDNVHIGAAAGSASALAKLSYMFR